MGKRITKEEINERLQSNFDQSVSLIGEYINNKTPIKIHCNDCGYEWETKPQNVIYSDCKHKCPNCGRKKGEYFHCAYCGKEVYRAPSKIIKNQSGLFYCSHLCGNLHKNQLRKESGEWDQSYSYRDRAFYNFEHKCAVCNWNEDERILEVHHIDENRKNNDITNLIILCPICHRKITLGYYDLDLQHKTLIDKRS